MFRMSCLVVLIGLISACSDDGDVVVDGAAVLDQGALDGGKADKGKVDKGKVDKGKVDKGKVDKGKVDKGPDSVATITEKEPNDGKTKTEFQAVSTPMVIKGAIGKADDIDLFGLKVQAGQRLKVTVKSGGSMQAHLAVFDLANKLPTAVNAGPGNGAMAEYYVLSNAATLLVGVRDRRNVGSGSQHVGGPKLTYTLSILPLSRKPVPISIGAEKKSSLSPAGTVRVFSFSANKNDKLQIRVRARALSPPSDMDSRLSLFCADQKTWHGTNDDAPGTKGDSLLEGSMPFTCTYHAVVENVKLNAAKLDFSLKITKQ